MSQCKGPGVGISEACSGNSKRAGLVSEHQGRGVMGNEVEEEVQG